ncbi:iron complex outermembrane recepter protein [Mesorhizobium sp. YR577]|nr:iron complex outermembrane recepter protein [Mesorhizobium sp. YR577]
MGVKSERGRDCMSARRWHVCTVSVIALAVGLSVASAPSYAQQSASGLASQSAIAFNIPSQSLNSAILAYADRAGIQIFYDVQRVSGLRSAPVRGSYTRQQALAQLLAGTGITYKFSGNTVSLTSPTSAGAAGTVAADGSIVLETITVQGANPNSTMGNLPEPYAGGQVARGGQVGMLGNRDVIDTPFSQTSYTNKTIQDQQSRTLNDIMANEPSVIIGTKGGGRNDWWTFRGFPVQTYLGSNSLNGLPGMAPLNYPSTDFIERVEVLRGPNALLKGTAMNGQGALGGTVDLVTKRAGDEPLTQLTTRYMSDSQIGAHVDLSRRFGDNKEFGIRFNGSLDGGDTPVDTQESRFRNAALNLDYRGERVRVSADFAHQSSSLSAAGSTLTINGVSGVLASLSKVPDAPSNKIAFSPSWAEGSHKVTLGMLQGEVDILDNVTAYAAIGKQRYEGASTDDDLLLLDNAGSVGIRPSRFRDSVDVLSMQGGVRATFDTGPVGHALSFDMSRIDWKYGSTPLSRAGAGAGDIIPVGSLYNPVFPTTPVFPPYQDILPAIENKASSIAIADTLSFLNDRVQFIAGVRYNEIEAHSFQYSSTNIQSTSYKSSAWSPSFALIVKPWENVSLYANYIQALEVGSSVGRNYANAGEVFPPYTSEQYEAGVKVDWGSVTTTLAVFQIAQPQTMSIDDPAGGLPTLTLDGEQRNRGLELAAYGELVDDVRILGGVTFMDARQTKNDNDRNGWRAANTPNFRAVIGAEWDTPFIDGLTLTGRLTHTGDVVALNRRRDLIIPSWTQIDLGARYTFNSAWNEKPVTINFNVDNVFDAKYWKASHPTAGNLMRSDARTFRLSTTFNF